MQSEDRNSTKPTHRRKEDNEKAVEDEKGESSSCQQRSIDPALKTHQSNPIDLTVNKIVLYRDTESGIKFNVLWCCDILQQ